MRELILWLFGEITGIVDCLLTLSAVIDWPSSTDVCNLKFILTILYRRSVLLGFIVSIEFFLVGKLHELLLWLFGEIIWHCGLSIDIICSN